MNPSLSDGDIPPLREDLLKSLGMTQDVPKEIKHRIDEVIKSEGLSKQDMTEVKETLKSKTFRNAKSVITDLIYYSKKLKDAIEDEDEKDQAELEASFRDIKIKTQNADKKFSCNPKVQQIANVSIAIHANELGQKMKADPSLIQESIKGFLVGGSQTTLLTLLLTSYLCYTGTQIGGLAFTSTGVTILSSGTTISLLSIGAGSFLIGGFIGVVYGAYKFGQASAK